MKLEKTGPDLSLVSLLASVWARLHFSFSNPFGNTQARYEATVMVGLLHQGF